MKQKFKVDLDIDDKPCTVLEFKTLLSRAAASIGATDTTGVVHIELVDDYDYKHLEAYIYREETDTEEQVREESQQRHAEEQRRQQQVFREYQERKEFERLKAKFEP